MVAKIVVATFVVGPNGDVLLRTCNDARFRNLYLPFGWQEWVNPSLRADEGPTDSAKRFLYEDMSLTLPLDQDVLAKEIETPGWVQAGTDTSWALAEDNKDAGILRKKMEDSLSVWGDFLVHPSPAPTAPIRTLQSYSLVVLDGGAWTKAVRLQDKFGNLSRTSLTAILSAEEIINKGLFGAWGCDQVLKGILEGMGVARANELPALKKVTSTYVGKPMPTYTSYLTKYRVLSHPHRR